MHMILQIHKYTKISNNIQKYPIIYKKYPIIYKKYPIIYKNKIIIIKKNLYRY